MMLRVDATLAAACRTAGLQALQYGSPEGLRYAYFATHFLILCGDLQQLAANPGSGLDSGTGLEGVGRATPAFHRVADPAVERGERVGIAHRRLAGDFHRVLQLVAERRELGDVVARRRDFDSDIAPLAVAAHETDPAAEHRGREQTPPDVDDEIRPIELIDELAAGRRAGDESANQHARRFVCSPDV